jgi:hypothetical protein
MRRVAIRRSMKGVTKMRAQALKKRAAARFSFETLESI